MNIETPLRVTSNLSSVPQPSTPAPERLGIVGLIICFGISALLTGCVSNVAHNSRYPTDYQVGATYKLKQPIYATAGDRWVFFTEYIFDRLPAGATAEEYEQKARDNRIYPSYDARSSGVVGVARAGSLIKVTKIQLERNPEVGRTVWVIGELIDVPWSHHRGVLNFISKDNEFDRAPKVDTNVLEIVTSR